MADGRKIPYLIELAADDKKIRQQMSKINWEEILGSKGKGFGDVLVSDAKEAKDQIKKTLGGLDIDWSKILGAKEIGQLEQAVTKALSKSRKEIELFAAGGDTTGLEKTIKYVSALGNELKGLGSSFDAASLARGMGAFMKVLTPLTSKFESLVDEPQKIEAAFDKLFSGSIVNGATHVNKAVESIAKTTEKTINVFARMDGVLKSQGGLEKTRESLEALYDLLSSNAKLPDFSGMSIEQLLRQVQKLDEQWDEIDKKSNFGAYTKEQDAQVAHIMAQLVQIDKLLPKDKKILVPVEFNGQQFGASVEDYEKDIKETATNIKKELDEVEEKIKKSLGDSFAEVISKQVSDIKLNLSINNESKEKLIASINEYVAELNKSPIDKIKLQLGDADVANVIENKSKRAYGNNVEDDDVNTTKLIEQTEKRFKGVRGAMYRNQNKILQQTKEWRQQMLEQFKFKSDDFEFKFNNNLIEELQSLFDEYGLKINIDPTYLADQIKTVLEGSSVSLSSGTASIEPSTMASAVAAGVRAALVGEPLTVHTLVNSAQERIPDATEQVVTEIEEVAKHLDVADEYVQDVVKKIKAVAKYAVKPADKDNVGAKATREQFKLLGIDLEKVFGATNDSQIATILENSLLKRGDFNKLVGSTVIDELSTFKGSSSNTISAFVNSLREMFYMLQEDTETVDEWNRKKHSREIFDYARGQAKAASSLRDVRSSIRTDKIPDIEYIDKAIAAMSAIGKNTDSLTTLKLAREKLGDKTDEQSIQEFNAVANEFYKNTTKVFYDIKKQAEDSFKGTVYFQGNKKGVVKKQNIESYKQLAKIGDDDVILDIRVTSSLNNVSLGTTKSKYKDRISPYEEKRLLDGKRGDYIVSPEYEKDILNRELEYGGFKPQGASTTDVNLDATLEANIKKREVLMAEIKANEEEKKLLKDQIDAADKQIADLTAKNNEIPQGRRDAALRKIADQEAKKSTLTNDIFWLEEQVGNGKEGDEQKVGSLTKQIEEQLGKRAIAERQLAELSELDVERRKKSLTNKVAEIEQDDLPKLQEELTKAQTKYSTANSEKILAQVEVNKANSALKAIPKNKANAEARAEAEARVHKANSELIRATERFEEASRDIDSITNQIENSKRKIENLQDQISGTTLETIRQEQIARIEAIDNAITSLENEFASKLAEKKAKETALKRTNATIDRARNNAALKTQYDLNSEVASKKSLEGRYKEVENNDKILQHEIDLTTSREIGIKKQKEYVALQEKVLMLQGQITKLEADGAKDDQIDAKRNELKVVQETIAVLDKERDETYREYNELKQKLPVLQDALRRGMPSEQFEKAEEDIKSIIKRIDELQNKINALGVGLGVREAREYTDVERKTYALDQIKLIDNDLITARAQKNVVAARIAKKDREIAEVDRWGLGAGIGKRALNQEKYRLTSEFMKSDYMQLFDNMFALKKQLEDAELAYQSAMSKYYSATDKQWNESLSKDERDIWETASLKALDEADSAKYLVDRISKEIIDTSGDENFFRKLMNLVDDRNDQLAVHMPTEDINNSKKVREFLLNDKNGQRIASQYESAEKAIWDEYYESLRQKKQSILQEFKDSITVEDGVLKAIFKTKDVLGERNELVEVYVRDVLRQSLVDAKEILEEEQTPIQSNIDRLYADRKTAIEYGGVGDKEILSADVIEDQIRKQTELDKLLDKRADKEKNLKDLEMAGVQDSDDSVKQANKEIERLDKEIARYEMLIRNRKKLVELRWDESKADSYTDEEKELHFTEQIVNCNQKIESSLAKQEELKRKIETASEEEKTNLQYQLSKEEEKVANWRETISRYEGRLQKVTTAKSEVASTIDGESSGGLIGSIKEALGNTDVNLTPVTEILERILEVLNKFTTEGIKGVGTKASSEEKPKQPKKTEADLIRDGALKQHDVVRGLAAGRGSLYDQYMRDVEDLNNAVKEANAASEKDKKKAIANVKTQAQKVSALSYNILKNTSQWDYLVANSDSGAKNLNLKSGESLRDKMEMMAKKEHGILGSRGGVKANPKYKYDFLGFDGNTLTYQLTDIEGKVRKVTMTWNEFTKQVVTTSDKTGYKLSELAGKVESFDEKFKNAINMGYLSDNDEAYKDFLNKVEKIKKATTLKGADLARNNALQAADLVTKQISQNKRLYTGTTEMNAVKRQFENLGAKGILDQTDLEKVEEYKKRYREIARIHQELLTKKNGIGLLDEDGQKQLRAAALEAKNLGKELEKSLTEAEQLQRLVDESGTFNGKQMGGVHQVTAEETENLEASMKSYLQSLGLGNIEHVKYDNIHKKLTGTLRTSNKTVAELEVKYNDTTKALYAYMKAEKESLTGIPAFLNGFQKKFNSIMQYLTMTMSIHRVLSEVRRGIQYVREIDKSLTELKKVTDETEATYDNFLKTAAKTGERLGSTISAVTEATATFAKLGYTMEQASEMAESAIVYKNVGDNIASTEDAADSIISTLKGFGLEASESMAIVDKFNEVGNRFAITSQGIGEALRLSASALNEGKNSLDESIALITAANEVVNDPSSVGTALKTLTLRLRGSKTELEEMREDVSDMATTTSQLQAKLLALTGGQVDIMLDENTFKNTTQILREMAAAWEDMNDIQRASALELMGGKRQANTLSALIQNFETVEKVIEASTNSAGSALKENERYLDSIQGKIDQFNNATQSMWNNFLDADLIKGIVEIGTWIIKLIDNIGILQSAFIAFAAISMVKNKMGPISFLQGISNIITSTVGKTKNFIASLIGMTTATSAYTAETLAASVANGTLSASEAASIAVKNGLALATTNLNAAEATEMLMRTGIAKADALSMVAKLGLTAETQALTLANIEEAVSAGKLTAAQGSQIASALGLSVANKGLAASFGALWTAMWPVLALMAGVAAIYGIVKLFDAMTVSAKEASEQLEETKNNISNLESELKSLQNELDETREKIAELTALPYLSLTQQEDLDRLEKEVELLERQIALKERQLAIEEAQLVEDAEVAINKNWGPTNKNKKDQKKLNNYIEEYQQTNEKIKNNEELYLQASKEIFDDQSLSYDTWKKMREAQGFDKDSITEDTFKSYDWQNLDKQKELLVAFDNQTKTLEADLINTASNIEKIFNDSTYAGLEYGMSDDIDDFLDDYNNAQLKWEKALYGDNSAVSAIESLWGPNASEEMKAVKNNIDEIMAEDGTWINDDEKWQSKNSKIKEYIESLDETADGYYQLDYVINELGITTDRIADYFTILNGEFNSNTLDGVTKQYADAAEVMNVLKNMSDNTFTLDGVSYDWNEFFTQDDQGKFKARSDEFAKILKNMDNNTRAAFISIVESAANAAGDISKIDWQQSISKMDLSGLGRTFDLINDEFESLNNEMFANIADDISGLIDTVGELKSALEDVAGSIELLSVAEDQMSNSGQISVKTALDLMSATDDYSKVVTVQNGVLQLAVGAQEHLTKAKFESIKTQLEASATLAEQTYQTALAANTELDYADNASVVMTAESIKAEAIGRVSAVIVALGAAMDAIQNGEWGSVFSSFGNTYTSATETVVAQSNAMKTSIAALERDAKNKRALADVYSFSDDYSSFTNNYDFDKTPGDKNGDKEKADDAFQREMDYWENRIAANQAKYGQLQNEIDRLESRGQKAGAGYYEEQIKLEGQRFSLLKQQKAAAQAHLATLEEGSDEWWEVADVLNGIEDDIDDITASIVELQDAIGDIETYKFEELNTRLDNLASKLGTIRDLIAPNGEEDWFDDEGNWTENGIAALATYVQELEFYKQGYKDTVDELAKYQLEYSTNEDYYESIGIHSEQELYDKTEELISQQYDYASSINDTEQSVVDMYESSIDAAEEYINTLIDGYNDYIDSVKEALDAERDLYDFKKNVQEQAKDIAELERRIASLSGSTNKSDIAERRKLEAQLYESRESLNDTYYDHAKDAQQEALDAEASAYEETMIKMVEGMRMSFEEATAEMDTFLNNVTIAVSMNADTVLAKYKETNIYLDPALTNPWENAKTAVGNYGGDATKLMDVWKQGGYFAEFSSTAGANLSSPWNKGTNAVNAFKSSVTLAMNNVVSDINSNVNTAAGSLSKLYQQIKDTEARAASAKANIENDLNRVQNVTDGNGSITSSTATVTATLNSSGKKFEAARTAKNESEARKAAKDAVIQLAYDYYRNRGYDDAWLDRKYSSWNSSVTYHAKGTLGTKRDEWAITDEPRFGDELVLVPGKDGNLSFMRKGTSVIPAEITTNLMEWGQFTPDAMSLGGGVNVNMINNSVMKPQYDLSFDSLVHVDNCSQETLKDLEKMVDNKINKFSKELNYSIKKFAR